MCGNNGCSHPDLDMASSTRCLLERPISLSRHHLHIFTVCVFWKLLNVSVTTYAPRSSRQIPQRISWSPPGA